MVEKLPFGEDGFLLRITDGAYTAEIVPYGASLRALRVPNRDGRPVDVVLGYDTPEEYLNQNGCLGAVVGRYANRISGAAFTLNAVRYPLFPNKGTYTLHGGKRGFHKRVWEIRPGGENRVVCAIDSPDGDEGFPGALHVEAAYTLRDGALTIAYDAVSDQDTVLNLTNHSYFNLAGHGGGSVEDHVVGLRASRYTPADGDNVPTGELDNVTGTPLDFQTPAVLGDRLGDLSLVITRGFDHNLVLDGGEGPAATVYCPRTGITLEMDTDREGVQLYTAGSLTERPGKDGAVYGPAHGLCLETQHFPDAVNKPDFPSPVLRAGERFHSETVYRFSAKTES